MPNNSWDAAVDSARHNPEQAAFDASDSVRVRASTAGVNEAYDMMRQQFSERQSDRRNSGANGTSATTLNFEDDVRSETQLAGNGEFVYRGQQRAPERYLAYLPSDIDRRPRFESESEQQDRRLERSRFQLEVAAYTTFRNPREREVFLANMRIFERRLGTSSPDELARTYDAVSRMMIGEGLTARGVSPENRSALARNFMHHAADPTNTDQGEFNTCSVTSMQEGLLTFRPSVVADMLAQASLTGEYRSLRDGRVIQLDRASMVPMAGSQHPDDSNIRSYATQVLNHVMVNEITQRYAQPAFYSQITRPTTHGDTGERLTLDSFTGDEVQRNGSPVRQPLVSIFEMADAMERYGLPGSIFYNNENYLRRNVVTFNSAEGMAERIRERIAAGAPIILYVRDVTPLAGGGSGAPQHTAHVISITGITANGFVRYSNQWGRHLDGVIRIEDLYRSTRPRS